MPRKGQINDRTGEHFVNNQGCSFFIVEYVNNNKCLVEFEDEFKGQRWVKYCHCVEGSVCNPFRRDVYGVGIRCGIKTKVNGKTTKEYSLWNDMLRRCYSEKYLEKYPTYQGCTVCERWHRFDLFLEDLPLIEGYELWINNSNPRAIHLDKDIKGGDKKIYSLETCMFIDQAENVRDAVSRRTKQPNAKPVKGINQQTGEVVEFNSASEASRALEINVCGIIGCCNKRYKVSGGYTWEYIGDNNA